MNINLSNILTVLCVLIIQPLAVSKSRRKGKEISLVCFWTFNVCLLWEAFIICTKLININHWFYFNTDFDFYYYCYHFCYQWFWEFFLRYHILYLNYYYYFRYIIRFVCFSTVSTLLYGFSFNFISHFI